MRPRTVLFVSQSATVIGGVQSRLDVLTERLPEAGWRVLVGLARGNRFHRPEAFRRLHPDLETLSLDGRSGTRAARELAIESVLRRVRPDVVVPLSMFDAFAAVRRAKERRSDLRFLFTLNEVCPQFLVDCQKNLSIIDRLLGVSRLAARLLVDIGADPSRVDHVSDGVPIPLAREASVPTPHEERNGSFRIGYVGRFSNDKRILDLVTVCRELDARGVDFKMIIVGEGPIGQDLEKAMAPWRDRDRVSLIGAMRRSDLYRTIYPRLDALLLPSALLSEGLPNAPMEAMIHGVVPVVSDFLGLREQGLLRHLETAMIFSPGDVAQAAGNLLALAENMGLRRELSSRGRREILSCYSIESMTAGWAACLSKALEQASRCDQGPPSRRQIEGRLERLLGRRAAEGVRRATGRRYLHPDASEWPHCGVWAPGEVEDMRRRLETYSGKDRHDLINSSSPDSIEGGETVHQCETPGFRSTRR